MLTAGRGSTLSRELHAAPGTLTALGVLGYAGSGSLASLALGLLPAGVTALMSNSRPLIVVMAGLLVFHQRVGLTQVRQFRLLLRANRTGKGIASERSAV